MIRRLLSVLGFDPDSDVPDREQVIAALRKLGVR
jgi:hypothetical protein